MAIYLKFGNVKGNVTAEGYAGQIALKRVRFGLGRNVSMDTGNLSNRESSKPSFDRIAIEKKADSSVVALLKEAASGSAGQEAIIAFVRTGTNKVEEYMTYKLTNCIISSYDIDADDDTGKEAVEILSLSYSAIEVSYKDHDASNKAGSPQRFSYDLKAAKIL